MRSALTLHMPLMLALSGGLIHLFCCGLPLVLSLLSLTSMFGAHGAEWLHDSWIGRNELLFYVASGAILALTGLAQLVAWRISCRTDGTCTHGPCDVKKTWSYRIFMAALALYVVNSFVLLLSH